MNHPSLHSPADRCPTICLPFFHQFLLAALLLGPLAALHAQEQGKPTNIASSASQTGGGTVREVSVVIDPVCTRRIEGTSDLNRSAYFSLFTNIDKLSGTIYEYSGSPLKQLKTYIPVVDPIENINQERPK